MPLVFFFFRLFLIDIVYNLAVVVFHSFPLAGPFLPFFFFFTGPILPRSFYQKSSPLAPILLPFNLITGFGPPSRAFVSSTSQFTFFPGIEAIKPLLQIFFFLFLSPLVQVENSFILQQN